jgi:hypothetical protein
MYRIRAHFLSGGATPGCIEIDLVLRIEDICLDTVRTYVDTYILNYGKGLRDHSEFNEKNMIK